MKIRKLTSLVLALVMLALPVLSLGEAASSMNAGRSKKTTVTFEPGDMLTQDASLSPIADLLKSLRIESLVQEKDNAAMSKADIFLQDNSALNFTMIVDPEQFHFMSNLLGDKTISFTFEEYMQFYLTQMENAMNQTGVDEGMAAMYKAYMDMYTSMMKGEMPELPSFDEESLQQDLLMPLTEWFTGLMSTPDVKTGTFESEKHDTATMQMVYSLSAEQISQLLTIVSDWASKDANLDTIFSFASTFNPDAGDLASAKAQIQEQLKAMPESFMKEAAPSIPEPFTITMLTDDAGNMVSVEVSARIFDKDNAESKDPKTSILAGYYVKTEEDGANNKFAFNVTSGTDVFSLSFSQKDVPESLQGSDTVSGSKWNVSVDVRQFDMDTFNMKLDFAGQKTASAAGGKDSWKLGAEFGNFGQVMGVLLDNTTTKVPSGADVKEDGKLDIYLTGQTAPLASIVYSSVTGDPVEFPAIPEDSVRPGKMTTEELEAFGQELSMTAMTELGKIMQFLPPSIMTMMSGGASTSF